MIKQDRPLKEIMPIGSHVKLMHKITLGILEGEVTYVSGDVVTIADKENVLMKHTIIGKHLDDYVLYDEQGKMDPFPDLYATFIYSLDRMITAADDSNTNLQDFKNALTEAQSKISDAFTTFLSSGKIGKFEDL